MTSYGYVRVSTDQQQTLLQVDALRAAGIDQIVEDHGVSGKTSARSRAGIKALLARLQRGDELVVYSVSRLGRSARDLLNTLHELDAAGVRFRSLTEQVDTSHYTGRLVVTILAAVAEMEREMTAERTRDMLASLKARGVPIGRPKGSTVPPDVQADYQALRGQGWSVADAAAVCGITRSQARRL